MPIPASTRGSKNWSLVIWDLLTCHNCMGLSCGKIAGPSWQCKKRIKRLMGAVCSNKATLFHTWRSSQGILVKPDELHVALICTPNWTNFLLPGRSWCRGLLVAVPDPSSVHPRGLEPLSHTIFCMLKPRSMRTEKVQYAMLQLQNLANIWRRTKIAAWCAHLFWRPLNFKAWCVAGTVCQAVWFCSSDCSLASAV